MFQPFYVTLEMCQGQEPDRDVSSLKLNDLCSVGIYAVKHDRIWTIIISHTRLLSLLNRRKSWLWFLVSVADKDTNLKT